MQRLKNEPGLIKSSKNTPLSDSILANFSPKKTTDFNDGFGTSTNIIVTNLSLGTNYYLSVTAVDAIGTGSFVVFPAPVQTLFLKLGPQSWVTTINSSPTQPGSISSASRSITTDTNSSSGFKLTMSSTDAQTGLINTSNSSKVILALSLSISSPGNLANNTWGFRVDGLASFDVGPTIAENNVASSAYKWAGIPAASSPIAIKSISTPVSNDSTTIWYAVNADTNLTSGTYSKSVFTV